MAWMTPARRDHSKLGNIENNESEGGSDMSSRAFPIHPKDRDLYGPEVYTQSNAKPTRFTPLFSRIWSLLVPKTSAAAGPYQRNVDLFPWFLRVTR